MPSSPRSATTSVAPNSRPRSVRSLCRPISMIRSAPSRLAASTADRPTAPSPITVTVVRGSDPGRHRAVVAGAEHVGQGQQRRQQRGVLADGQLHQRALRLRHPHGLALAAVHAVRAPEAAVPAGGLQALGAEVAGVVRPHERRDHDVTGLQPGHLRADVLDDAEELVADAVALLGGRHRPVGPQVAAADARAQHAHDGVGGLPQHRVGHVLDPHVTGTVDQGCSHEFAFLLRHPEIPKAARVRDRR